MFDGYTEIYIESWAFQRQAVLINGNYTSKGRAQAVLQYVRNEKFRTNSGFEKVIEVWKIIPRDTAKYHKELLTQSGYYRAVEQRKSIELKLEENQKALKLLTTETH